MKLPRLSCLISVPAAWAVLALWVGAAQSQPPAAWAVVRVPSHGASCTVIETAQGRTLLLGCAHAFNGANRMKKLSLDVPDAQPSAGQRVTMRVLAIDGQLDLSLVEMSAGPLPYVAPVAATSQPGPAWSIGYDRMQTPATMKRVTIQRQDGRTTWTREPPWHGRSGGALLDDQGNLVGVVSGYVSYPAGPGVYVSLAAIRGFLARVAGGGNPGMLPGPYPPVPQSPQWPSPFGLPEQGNPYCPDCPNGRCPLPGRR